MLKIRRKRNTLQQAIETRFSHDCLTLILFIASIIRVGLYVSDYFKILATFDPKSLHGDIQGLKK